MLSSLKYHLVGFMEPPSFLTVDMWKQTPQLTESYKAGMFIMVLGARGIAPSNLHTKS